MLIQVEKYEDEYDISYLAEWYDFFQTNKDKFDEIFHQKEYNWGEWNNMLEKYGSPSKFSKMATTGYSTIFTNLLSPNNKVYVSGFTLYEGELRESAGDADGIAIKRNQGESCHSFSEESRILVWLHNNKKIDASLCMLEDTEELSFKTNKCNTEPSEFILDLLSKRQG